MVDMNHQILSLAHTSLRSSTRSKYLTMIQERVAGGGYPEVSIDDAERVVRQVVEDPDNRWAIDMILANAQMPSWVRKELSRMEGQEMQRSKDQQQRSAAPQEGEASHA